jgi:Tfp pilus assembly protein PilO
MDLSNFKEIIAILFILIIFLLNIWLFTAFKKNKSTSLDILRKSTETLRNPFKQENQKIDELSNLVKNLSKENNNQHNEEIE